MKFFTEIEDDIVDVVDSVSAPKHSIFDIIGFLTIKKVPWDQLSDADKATFNPYMVNRFLSMNYGLVNTINGIQKYITDVLDKDVAYKLLFAILPKKQVAINYIKSKHADRYNEKVIQTISDYFSVGKRDAIDYAHIFYMSDDGLAELRKILSYFAVTDKEITKLLKIK
jgi:hypothetical protein